MRGQIKGENFTAALWCDLFKSVSLASVACMYMCGVTIAEPRPLPGNLSEEVIEEAVEAIISEAAAPAECKNAGGPKKTLQGKGCVQFINNRALCNASSAKYEVTQECENCNAKTLSTKGSAQCIFIPDPSPLPGSSHLGQCAQSGTITWDHTKLDCAKQGSVKGVK
jgi:hypothetical protein